MKRIAIALLAVLLAFPAFAQTGGTHQATGVITRVDAAKGKVSIKHDPVKSLGWPSMTMAFTVKDKALLDKMKKDQKIDFEFVEQGKDYVVTRVK